MRPLVEARQVQVQLEALQPKVANPIVRIVARRQADSKSASGRLC